MTPFEAWWKDTGDSLQAIDELMVRPNPMFLAKAAWDAALKWQATQGGKSKAPRKVAAAKKNGKKGGRAKKAR